MSKTCMNCLFGDKCRKNDICDDYYPLYDYDDDEYIDDMIKEGYKRFLDEWYIYANEYSD